MYTEMIINQCIVQKEIKMKGKQERKFSLQSLVAINILHRPHLAVLKKSISLNICTLYPRKYMNYLTQMGARGSAVG